MITIANTITIAIAIAVAIAIFPVSPGPNAGSYTYKRWEVETRFCMKIWVGDLLSPRSNCLPFLRNLRLQWSTPWVWGILRSYRGGRAKDKVQTMILADVMISANTRRLPSATCHMPPAKHCPPYATCLTPPGAWLLQLRRSLDRAFRSVHGSILSSENASVFRLESVLGSNSEVYLGAYSEVFLGVSWELTWECIVKQAESVPSSAIGSVLESMLKSAIESVLRAYLGAYSQAGWERVIECNWECTSEHARECDWEHL